MQISHQVCGDGVFTIGVYLLHLDVWYLPTFPRHCAGTKIRPSSANKASQPYRGKDMDHKSMKAWTAFVWHAVLFFAVVCRDKADGLMPTTTKLSMPTYIFGEKRPLVKRLHKRVVELIGRGVIVSAVGQSVRSIYPSQGLPRPVIRAVVGSGPFFPPTQIWVYA